MQINVFTKQKQTHRLGENELGGGGKVCKGGRVSKGCWAFGIHMYTLLCLKQITNKDLLYNTGNLAQYTLIT